MIPTLGQTVGVKMTVEEAIKAVEKIKFPFSNPINEKKTKDILMYVACGKYTYREIAPMFAMTHQNIQHIWNKYMPGVAKPLSEELRFKWWQKMFRNYADNEFTGSYCQRADCGLPIKGKIYEVDGLKFCSPYCADMLEEKRIGFY